MMRNPWGGGLGSAADGQVLQSSQGGHTLWVEPRAAQQAPTDIPHDMDIYRGVCRQCGMTQEQLVNMSHYVPCNAPAIAGYTADLLVIDDPLGEELADRRRRLLLLTC